MRRALPILLLLALAGCRELTDVAPKPTVRITPPGAVELVVGQSVMITAPAPGMKVTFVAVDDDSRCPEEVQCIWAGDAAVRLLLGEANPVALVLHTPTAEVGPRVGTHGAWEVELLALTPIPRQGRPREQPYRARLAVRVRPE